MMYADVKWTIQDLTTNGSGKGQPFIHRTRLVSLSNLTCFQMCFLS